MTNRQKLISAKTRERQYSAGCDNATQTLVGIGYSKCEFSKLALAETVEIWPRFIGRLRLESKHAVHFDADEANRVRELLERVADETPRVRAIWFSLFNQQPIGIELPAARLLRSSLGYIVTFAGDLMLSSRDAKDGICVEQNHAANGDEYELVSWGCFGM